MPIYTFRCKRCGEIDDRITGAISPDSTCRCGGEMERLSVFTPHIVGKREKPLGFKYEPKEMNADKDRWAHFKGLEESDKIKELPKVEVNWWHKTLKKIGKKEGWL